MDGKLYLSGANKRGVIEVYPNKGGKNICIKDTTLQLNAYGLELELLPRTRELSN